MNAVKRRVAGVDCRLQQMWEAEVKVKGLHCASLRVVVARFTRSFLLPASLLTVLNVIFTFLGPVSCYYLDNEVL